MGKCIIKNGKISTKIHEIGKIKVIFGLGMTPILAVKNGQIKSLPGHEESYSHMGCSVLFFQNLPSDAHVIAVDLPGHGDSDTPTDDYDISHMNTVIKMHKVFFY